MSPLVRGLLLAVLATGLSASKPAAGPHPRTHVRNERRSGIGLILGRPPFIKLSQDSYGVGVDRDD